MIALVSVKTYLGVYPVIDHPEWAGDPAYNTLAGTMKSRSTIMTAIAQWASSRSAEECEHLMSEAGVPCTIYRSPAEQLANPHLIERRAFQEICHGETVFSVLSSPFKISSANCDAKPFVSLPGEHTKKYLIEA